MDKDDNKQSEKRVKLFTTKQNVIARKKKTSKFSRVSSHFELYCILKNYFKQNAIKDILKNSINLK